MKYVRLLWHDATSVDEWTQDEDLYLHCNLIETVGIIINETKDIISVALNHDHDSKAKSCYMNIPKTWIKDRTVLGPKKK